MPNPQTPIESGKYFHIYNCSIGTCDLFREETNYVHFMKLYDKYISPIADTYAWVLMKNHFHFLVRIKNEEDIGFVLHKDCTRSDKKCVPINQFKHLFNAYAQDFNRKYDRRGGLFFNQFKRIHVDNEQYYKRLVAYIHNNPVHHGFTKHPSEYPWSSYKTVLSTKLTKLERETVLGWFGTSEEYRIYHDKYDCEADFSLFKI